MDDDECDSMDEANESGDVANTQSQFTEIGDRSVNANVNLYEGIDVTGLGAVLSEVCWNGERLTVK